MVQVTLLQAAHFTPLSFVLEPWSQQACKIDELVHGLLLRGQLGVGGGGGGVTFHTHVSGDNGLFCAVAV